MRALSPEVIQYGGLGLGLLSLVLQMSGGKGPDVASTRDAQILQLSQTAIQSARGTSICISWDCTGQPTQAPQAPPTQVVYYKAEPGTAYVDQQGQPVPLVKGNDGHTYVAVAGTP